MGQGFSLSDDNLDKLYEGTANKDDIGEIVQDDWRIIVTNLGPKLAKYVLYSMTAEKKGWVVGGKHEITLSANRGPNDKANMRNKINLRINQIIAHAKLKL